MNAPAISIWNDIEIIDTYAPFVDWMLVDRFCLDLIKTAKLTVKCEFSTVTSLNELRMKIEAPVG